MFLHSHRGTNLTYALGIGEFKTTLTNILGSQHTAEIYGQLIAAPFPDMCDSVMDTLVLQVYI